MANYNPQERSIDGLLEDLIRFRRLLSSVSLQEHAIVRDLLDAATAHYRTLVMKKSNQSFKDLKLDLITLPSNMIETISDTTEFFFRFSASTKLKRLYEETEKLHLERKEINGITNVLKFVKDDENLVFCHSSDLRSFVKWIEDPSISRKLVVGLRNCLITMVWEVGILLTRAVFFMSQFFVLQDFISVTRLILDLLVWAVSGELYCPVIAHVEEVLKFAYAELRSWYSHMSAEVKAERMYLGESEFSLNLDVLLYELLVMILDLECVCQMPLFPVSTMPMKEANLLTERGYFIFEERMSDFSAKIAELMIDFATFSKGFYAEECAGYATVMLKIDELLEKARAEY